MNKFTSALWAGCAIGLVLLGTGCGGGTSPVPGVPTPTPTPTPSPIPTDGAVSATGRYQDLVFTVTAPKGNYIQGEPVPLTFTVQNNSTQEAVFQYSTLAPEPCNGTVYSSDGNIVRTHIIYGFPGASDPGNYQYLRIPAGQTSTFDMPWNQKNQSLNEQVPAGTYRIKAYIDQIGLDPAGLPHGDVLTTDYLNITVQ